MAADQKCSTCKETILEQSDGLICSGDCREYFHFDCAGFQEVAFRKMGVERKKIWKCTSCRPKTRNAVEIVNKVSSQNSDKTIVVDASSQASIPDMSVLPNSIKECFTELSNYIKEEVKMLKDFVHQRFIEYEKSLEYNHELIENLTLNVKSLTSDLQDLKLHHEEIVKENKSLKSEVTQLKADLVELKQYSRRTNLEINNLPESENEDLKDVLKSIFAALNVDLINHTTAYHRVPTTRKDKPKPIIIQFDTKATRDSCLKAAKDKRLKTTDVNPRLVSNPLYFNEHLTPELKHLHYLCRKFKKENNYNFCWVKDGKLFLRENQTSKVLRVTSSDNLPNVS